MCLIPHQLLNLNVVPSRQANSIVSPCIKMGKDTLKPTTAAVAVAASKPASARTASMDETIPESLLHNLGKLLTASAASDANATTNSTNNNDDKLEEALIDAVEQVMDGSLKISQFVALLKAVQFSTASKTANICVVNVLWLCGTQVRQAKI